MTKSILATFMYRLYVGVMFWGSIPLGIILFVWEHNLAISDKNHEVVQILLVFFIIGWAFVWNSVGEYHRISHYTDQNETLSKGVHYQLVTTQSLFSESTPGYPNKKPTSLLTNSSTKQETYHVSNN